LAAIVSFWIESIEAKGRGGKKAGLTNSGDGLGFIPLS
jgi:hypothetical protein